MNTLYKPTQDSTVYSSKSLWELNFGRSEILELKNTFSESVGQTNSQILIQFETPIKKEELKNYPNIKFTLELKITESEDLSGEVGVSAYPVCDEWIEGNGRGSDTDPLYDPVNWIYKTSDTKWVEEGNTGPTYYTHIQDCTGITYEINSKFILENKTSDVSIDITNIALRWIMGDIPNNGLVLKLIDDSSNTQNSVGSLKFFSRDTNTIYSPSLRLSYVDYSFYGCKTTTNQECGHFNGLSGSISGSLIESETDYVGFFDAGVDIADEIPSDVTKIITSTCQEVVYKEHSVTASDELTKVSGQLFPKIKNIKKIYRTSEIVRMDVGIRNKNPIKTFNKKASYLGNNYTDYDMFYGIRDAETQENIIMFDKYSQVSCDESGHFFNMSYSCLQPGRYYKFFLMIHGEYGDEVFEDERTLSVEM